jgi:hypothetical protein
VARYKVAVESQAAQGAGLPSGLTFNGYFGALISGSTANLKLRRIVLGVRATTPTSQQVTVRLYRQTVRAVGTGFSTSAGINMDPRGPTSPQSPGFDITTGTAAGTTGPTLGAGALEPITFNTLSGVDMPYDYLEELFSDQGNANGLAFVNFGAALPAAHVFTLGLEWEE